MAKKSPKKVPKKAARKTAKKSPKKASKKAVKKTAAKPQGNLLPILLFIIAAIAIIVGLYGLLAPEEVPQSEVAATVNGVEITRHQLETQYAILPEQYKAVYTEELVLQQLIDEEVLLQYGAEQGVSTDAEAVNEEIQSILASGQITVDELQENLERFNMTLEEFEALIERKILIEQSMNLVLEQATPASEEEAQAYYDANSAEYVTEEQVQARHILIASQRENAAQLSKDLMEQVQSGADFCALVTEETDDKGSVQTCGEYTFPRGMMVPEFEKASFDMAPGDVTVVQTTFGYHVIEKIADVPAGVTAFEDVKDDIIALLSQQSRLEAYQEFLEEQKASADIQTFE